MYKSDATLLSLKTTNDFALILEYKFCGKVDQLQPSAYKL